MAARVDKYLNQLVGSSNGLPTFFVPCLAVTERDCHGLFQASQ